MYPTSDDYKQAIASSTQRHRMSISFSLPGASVPIILTDEDIIQGSFEITSQCSDSKDLKPGGVFISQLKVSFRSSELEPYVYNTVGSTLTPTFGLLVDEDSDTWEEIPLGIFTIAESKWTERGINITAYDNMSKLDKPCSLDSTVGIPWQIMTLICNMAGVTFGTSAVGMQDFPNANEVLGLYPENDITTYRDALSYICQAAGCFATADREGNIIVRRFGQEFPAMTIDTTKRFTGASLSDYRTFYSRIRDHDVTYGTGDGTLIDFGANPFLVYGNVDDCHQALVDEISEWIFTPFEASMIGDPAIDLGDLIHFSGGIFRTGRACLVNKIVFKYKKGISYSGFGANPMIAQANQNRSDKAAKGASNAAKAQEIKYLSYINAAEIRLEPYEETTVCFLDFSLSKTSMVEFWLQSQIISGLVYGLTARVYLNDELIMTLAQGRHNEPDFPYDVFTLMAFTEAPDNVPLTLRVTFEVEWHAIVIHAEDLRALLKGQGISTETPWDGKIRIEEALEFIYQCELAIKDVEEGTVNVSFQTPIEAYSGNDEIELVGIETEIVDIAESVNVIVDYTADAQFAGDGYIADDDMLL